MDAENEAVLDDAEEVTNLGCDPYLCHYLRVKQIIKKMNRIVRKIKMRAGSDKTIT